MTIGYRIRRLAVPVTAFALVTGGALLALPDDNSSSDAAQKAPTVVVVDNVESGTPTDEVRKHVEVRQVDVSARADGAFASLDEIPAGVLVADHVGGQQLLATSISKNVVTAVGEGFVSVSVRLDSQRWVGPVKATGSTVNVFAINAGVATLVSPDAVVLDSPDFSDLKPRDDAIVSLAVRNDTLAAVLVAAAEDKLWLTGR